jgi:hypothetical protein
MINIQTDLLPLTSDSLSKMNRQTLERVAIEGTAEQKQQLIDWGYSKLPAYFFEDLYLMATGQEWEQD